MFSAKLQPAALKAFRLKVEGKNSSPLTTYFTHGERLPFTDAAVIVYNNRRMRCQYNDRRECVKGKEVWSVKWLFGFFFLTKKLSILSRILYCSFTGAPDVHPEGHKLQQASELIVTLYEPDWSRAVKRACETSDEEIVISSDPVWRNRVYFRWACNWEKIMCFRQRTLSYYDSEKTVVLRWEAGQPVCNPAFVAFITHYGVRPVICARGRPQTKGISH